VKIASWVTAAVTAGGGVVIGAVVRDLPVKARRKCEKILDAEIDLLVPEVKREALKNALHEDIRQIIAENGVGLGHTLTLITYVVPMYAVVARRTKKFK